MSVEPEAQKAYVELEQRLRPFIARRVPASDVDDVLQDAFLRIQRALPALREQERLGPWAYQVARSAVSESHRQRLRHPLPESEAADEALAASEEQSDPSPIELEIASYIVPFVAMLPSPYREALTLTELEGLSQKAAADAFGVSLSAMKSRVQRGRAKLREILDACCRIATDARGRVIECAPRSPADCRCRGE